MTRSSPCRSHCFNHCWRCLRVLWPRGYSLRRVGLLISDLLAEISDMIRREVGPVDRKWARVNGLLPRGVGAREPMNQIGEEIVWRGCRASPARYAR
jgi:hypothetical protein